jgi:hypothetical protein
MISFVRCAAAAAAALVLSAPALAVAPQAAESPAAAPAPPAAVAPRPTAVVVRIDGGFHPENRWLWYDQDGTARFEGIIATQRGRFRSRVDYAKVERLLTDAELCTRGATLVRPAGMDMLAYHVSVRCGNGWRIFTTYDVTEPETNAHVRDAVRGLERLAANLPWEFTSEEVRLPDNDMIRPARPAENRRSPAIP